MSQLKALDSEHLTARIREIEYQLIKNLDWTPTDDQFVKIAASVLHATLKNETTLTGASLPILFAGCNLDWSQGTLDDTNVKITKGSKSVVVNIRVGIGSDEPTVEPETPADWTTATKSKIFASDFVAGDNFGKSIDVCDDYVVIGAPLADPSSAADSGAVYVYGYVNASWTQIAKLVPSDSAAGDNFGWSVSINSDYIVVGSPLAEFTPSGEGATPVSNTGAVYIFKKNGSTWNQYLKLNASDYQANDNFGWSVKINSSNNIIIGAPLVDITPAGEGATAVTDTGAVYIFKFDGTNWGQTKLNASEYYANDNFGWSVDMNDDNVALIGSPLVDLTPTGEGATQQADAGVAYIFGYNGSTWVQSSKLSATNFTASDNFGWSVSITWDDLVIGSPLSDVSGKADSGAAYVYSKVDGNWVYNTKLSPASSAAGDNFGKSVYVAGKYMSIGSPSYDVPAGEGTTSDAGAIYIYRKNEDGTWANEQILKATDPVASDNFGSAVATKGSYTFAASPNADLLPAGEGATLQNNSGAVYTFTSTTPIGYGTGLQKDKSLLTIGYSLPTVDLSQVVSHLTFPTTCANGSTVTWQSNNTAISSSGVITPRYNEDVTGTVTATLSLDGVTTTKSFNVTVLKLLGVSTKLTTKTASTPTAEQLYGRNSVICGNYMAITDFRNSKVYIYYYNGSEWGNEYEIAGPTNSNFGLKVAMDGDYLVVYSNEDDSNNNTSTIYVFHRTGTNTWDAGTKLTPSVSNTSPGIYSFAISGDYIVVDLANSSESNYKGAAIVFHRTGTNTWDTGVVIAGSDLLAYDNFGQSVSISGDYIAIGAHNKEVSGRAEAGAVYIFHRTGENTWIEDTKLLDPLETQDDQFGLTVYISNNTLYVSSSYAGYAGLIESVKEIGHIQQK